MDEMETASLPLLELMNTYARASRTKIKFPAIDSSYTLTEIQLLRRIKLRPGSNIIELSKFLGVTKGLVSRTINDLANNGIVTKERQEGSKKEIAIFLTGVGESHLQTIVDEAKPLFEPINKYISGIPQQYLDQFRVLLTEITNFIRKLTE